LFEQQVQKTPDAVAVRFQSGSVTYGELNQAANEVTQRLQGLGVGPDSIVAVCLEPSAEMLPGVLGVLKAGGAYLPLDHACPKERLEFMLKDSGARVLLTQKSLREHFRFAHPYLRPVCLDEPEPMPHPASRIPDSKAPVSPDNPACVFYTTDLEGNPIGVPVHHRALVNLLFSMWRQPGIGRHDVLLALNPLFFDIATLELFLPLSVGARVELASNQEAADGRQLAAKIESAAATVMQATPATWRLLLNAGWRGSQSFKMLCGSQGLTTELATELLSRGELWNLYGATETTIWSTVYKVESGQGPIPIGRPIANTQVFILDALQQPVPIGVPGELFIGGDGLTRGYLNQPERTAEKFIPHPFHEDPEARLYKTGDLARYRADGSIEYLGRIGDQVE
jgi:amino acid adenylation domain-containing protein